MDKNLSQISQPGSSDILDGVKRQTKFTLNCHQIGTIQTFDPATQLASIQIAMKQVKDVLEDGTKTFQEYPVLLECPVVVLFGGVDFLSMPIQPGDSCIVLFNDREIDQWLYHGDGQYPVTVRLHDISDAFALVGIRSLTNSIASYLSNGIRLSHGNGSSQIDLKTALIESVAALFLHHGSMEITENLKVDEDAEVVGDALVRGGLTVLGDTKGNGGTFSIDDNVQVTSGHQLTAPVLNAQNGANGTFNIVTVVNGIVVSGS